MKIEQVNECARCKGDGRIPMQHLYADLGGEYLGTCPDCNGSGSVGRSLSSCGEFEEIDIPEFLRRHTKESP